MRNPMFFLTFLFMIMANLVAGQGESKALVSFHNGIVFIGVDNRFRVVIQQQEPISLAQLDAALLTYGEEVEPIPLEISQNNYGFALQPRENGVVRITVKLKNGVQEQYNFNAKPIQGVSRLGMWDARTNESIPAIAFKPQTGIYTQVEGFDICASCNTISYEVIRVTEKKEAKIVLNEGGKYEHEARELIDLAKPGDRYIFTKIRYRCPGALVDQMGETLSFELK